MLGSVFSQLSCFVVVRHHCLLPALPDLHAPCSQLFMINLKSNPLSTRSSSTLLVARSSYPSSAFTVNVIIRSPLMFALLLLHFERSSSKLGSYKYTLLVTSIVNLLKDWWNNCVNFLKATRESKVFFLVCRENPYKVGQGQKSVFFITFFFLFFFVVCRVFRIRWT